MFQIPFQELFSYYHFLICILIKPELYDTTDDLLTSDGHETSSAMWPHTLGTGRGTSPGTSLLTVTWHRWPSLCSHSSWQRDTSGRCGVLLTATPSRQCCQPTNQPTSTCTEQCTFAFKATVQPHYNFTVGLITKATRLNLCYLYKVMLTVVTLPKMMLTVVSFSTVLFAAVTFSWAIFTVVTLPTTTLIVNTVPEGNTHHT